MRNDEVTEAMKQMEANFKTHAENQLTSYTKLLEQYLATTYLRFSQMQQQFAELNAAGKGDNGGGGSNVNGNGRVSGGGSDNRDVGVDQGTNQILRTLRVDVPKFNGSQVHQWIYKTEKFFSLQSLP